MCRDGKHRYGRNGWWVEVAIEDVSIEKLERVVSWFLF